MNEYIFILNNIPRDVGTSVFSVGKMYQTLTHSESWRECEGKNENFVSRLRAVPTVHRATKKENEEEGREKLPLAVGK